MNKIPLILAILAVCNGLYVPVAQAYVTETTEIQQQREVKSTVANEVLSPYLRFTMLSITENSAKVAFNQGKVETIGIRNLYFASYNHEKVTMSYADAHLSELGVKPADELKADWANVVLAARDQNLIMGAALIGGGSGSSNKYLTNHPGILYYAAEIYDQTADEYYWVRGKISYRKPMYYHAAPNKMVMDCYGSVVGGKYFFESMVDQMPDNQFVPWSTEWHDDLVEDLAALEKDILAWTGDATQKAEYLTELARINNVAEDADDTAGLRTEVARLEDLLKQRAQTIESGNTGGDNTGDGDGNQTTTGGNTNPNEGGNQTGGNDDTGGTDNTGNTGNAGGEGSGNGDSNTGDGTGTGSGTGDSTGSGTGSGTGDNQNPNDDHSSGNNPNPGENNPNQGPTQDPNKNPNQDPSTPGSTNRPVYTGSQAGASDTQLANQNTGLGRGEHQPTTSATVKTPAANTLATVTKPNSAPKSTVMSKNDQRSVENSATDSVSVANNAEKVKLPLEVPTLSQEEIAEKSGIWPIILTFLGLGAASAWGIWLFLSKRKKNDESTDRHF